MSRTLNVIALTLLIAMASVIPATLVIRYVPRAFNPGLQGIAVAAWLSGLACWYLARHAARQEQEAAMAAHGGGPKGSSTLAIAAVCLAVAGGIAVALHFYGDRLLAVVR